MIINIDKSIEMIKAEVEQLGVAAKSADSLYQQRLGMLNLLLQFKAEGIRLIKDDEAEKHV